MHRRQNSWSCPSPQMSFFLPSCLRNSCINWDTLAHSVETSKGNQRLKTTYVYSHCCYVSLMAVCTVVTQDKTSGAVAIINLTSCYAYGKKGSPWMSSPEIKCVAVTLFSSVKNTLAWTGCILLPTKGRKGSEILTCP